MKLEEILCYIKNELNIEYSVFFPNYEIDYRLSSLKNIVNKGLYYIVGENLAMVEKITNGLIITNKISNTLCDNNSYILVDSPQLLHYQVSNFFVKKKKNKIHETAIIHPMAAIGDNVNIGPYCIIGKVQLEQNVYLESHVVIKDNVYIAENVYIDSNSCIGASGIAWIWDKKGKRIIQPQIGGVKINKNCYLGTDVTVVRGSLSENTEIGEGTVIAHGSKIGHGVIIGEFVHMANNVSLAGNAVIGNRSFLGSASVVSSNIRIANNTIVGAGAVVHKNVKEQFCTLVGVPAKIIIKNNFLNKPKGAPKPFKK